MNWLVVWLVTTTSSYGMSAPVDAYTGEPANMIPLGLMIEHKKSVKGKLFFTKAEAERFIEEAPTTTKLKMRLVELNE